MAVDLGQIGLVTISMAYLECTDTFMLHLCMISVASLLMIKLEEYFKTWWPALFLGFFFALIFVGMVRFLSEIEKMECVRDRYEEEDEHLGLTARRNMMNLVQFLFFYLFLLDYYIP